MEKTVPTIASTKRDRVKGNGPGRKALKPFAHLGTLPPSLVGYLVAIAHEFAGDDLGGDSYSITQECNIEGIFGVTGETYRQILLQHQGSIFKKTLTDETVYSFWKEKHSGIDALKEFLCQEMENVYRFRISELKIGQKIDWHIDTDTSVMCRAVICLNDNDSLFKIKAKGKVYETHMKPGDIWFVNSGWPHCVDNTLGNTDRLVALFSFEFHDYKYCDSLLVGGA